MLPPPERPVPALTLRLECCKPAFPSVVVPAAVRRPWASTLNVGTAVVEPYVPPVTAVFARLIVVVPPKETLPPPERPVPAVTLRLEFCSPLLLNVVVPAAVRRPW